jgi:lysophospholipase L1-like esterase
MACATLVLLIVLHPLHAQTLIPVADLTFSPYNWGPPSTGADASAFTSNPGAWLRFSFTGSSSATLLLNTSALASAPDGGSCLALAVSIDDGPWALLRPRAGSPNASVVLAAGLQPGAPHNVRVHLLATCETADRWLRAPAGGAFWVVRGAALDTGASPLPPGALRPGTALVFGDSISEGTNAQNYDVAAARCGGPYGLAVSSALDTWAAGFAEAMNAELGLAAFAAQGYSTRNSLHYGSVPPLLTAGDEAATAWDKVCAGTSRLPALAARAPTYVVNALGFNDQNADVAPALLQATVAAWLPAARAAVDPTTTLLVVVPFGGEMRTNNATRLALRAGFFSYKASAAGAADGCALLVDLYPAAQRGLQGLGRPTAESCDGTHPLARRHAQLGAMVAAAAARALDAAPPGCARTDKTTSS